MIRRRIRSFLVWLVRPVEPIPSRVTRHDDYYRAALRERVALRTARPYYPHLDHEDRQATRSDDH